MKYTVVDSPDGESVLGAFASFEDAILFAAKEAKKRNRNSESYLHAGLDAQGDRYFFAGACPDQEDGSYWPRVIAD